jgi:hypothetical protein
MRLQDAKVGMRFRVRGASANDLWEIKEVREYRIVVSTLGAKHTMGRAEFAQMVSSGIFKIEGAEA